MIRLTKYIILLWAFSLLFSCYRDQDSIELVEEAQYHGNESNVEALVNSLTPEIINKFTYDNDRLKPLDLIQFDLFSNEGIQFDLEPLLFNDRNDELYRGVVEVSIEHMTKPEHYLRRGLNTQLRDQSTLDIDIAIRIVFKDQNGYRLKLRQGLKIELLSRSTFDPENIYTLDAPDDGFPYAWKDHPMKEDMNLSIAHVTIDEEALNKYNFTMRDNQWISLGKTSLLASDTNLCIDYVPEDINLLDDEKTLAFAVIGESDEHNQIVQFHLDQDNIAFCTDVYPTNAQSRIVVYAMENYVDRYYYEKFHTDNGASQITIQKQSTSLEAMIAKLSSI